MIRNFRRRALILGFLALWVLAGGLAPAVAGPYRDYAVQLTTRAPEGSQFRPDLEEALAQLANRYRASEGLETLTPDPLFQIAARAHAADMMLHDFMGHRASTGHDFDSRMRAFVDDITRFPGLAENAARDSRKTPADAAKARRLFQQWVKSRPHRKTLRSRDYAFVSTGVIQRGQVIWAVQIFWSAPRQKGMFQ